MDERLAQIAEHIGCQNVLIQLAEERSELSQACLKLLRSQEGLTPVKEDVCIDNLAEELADVKICMEQIEHMYQILQEKEGCIRAHKIQRWYTRTFEGQDKA